MKQIHVIGANIRHNDSVGKPEKPVILVVDGDKQIHCNGVKGDGPFELVYSDDYRIVNGLPIKVWIETEGEVSYE